MERKGFLSSLCLVVALSGCHRDHFVDNPRSAPGVILRDVSLKSAALGRTVTYRVYLPDGAAAGARLPVVYLLHGGGGDFRDWSNSSDVAGWAARGALGSQGAILVMPDGGFSYYMNEALKPRERYEDFITGELVRDVESRFPASGERAIVGVSMGGFAAVEYALARPGLYRFAGALSPAIEVTSRGLRLDFGQWLRFRDIFGPMDSETRKAHDPFALVKTADPQKTAYIYLTAGEQEPLAAPIRRFAAQLKARGFAYELHTSRGGHDWRQWNEQTPGCFASLRAHLANAQRAPMTAAN